MDYTFSFFFFFKIQRCWRRGKRVRERRNSGKRSGKKRKKEKANDISCVTKVRGEDKNLTLFRSDEVCVFYEIRFLNFARWFPRSGSRKDNGAFATFFPACKVSEPLMDTSATFSETLSAR